MVTDCESKPSKRYLNQMNKTVVSSNSDITNIKHKEKPVQPLSLVLKPNQFPAVLPSF